MHRIQSLCANVILLCVGFILFYLVSPFPALAQFGIGGQGLSLSISPTYPQPGGEVTVSLNDYSINAIGAQVFWFVNGTEIAESKNDRAITITAGSLGEETTVQVVLQRPDGSSIAATNTISPSVVDLILEADTYTPSFYRGRALPSRSGSVRAIALVHTGSELPESAYTYRWQLGSDVLFDGPMLGRNSVTFDVPIFSQDLSVEVFNAAGQSMGRGAIKIRSTEPELYFYEWSPLRGLSQKVISSPFPLIGDETVVYAEPYFVNRVAGGEYSNTAWTVNRNAVAADPASPRAIPLNRDLIMRSASVAFSLITEDRTPQRVSGMFEVIPN
jgi:hypothetical protein